MAGIRLTPKYRKLCKYPRIWKILSSIWQTIVILKAFLSVRNKNGFRSMSFEKISLLDSNFIHRYIIIKMWVKFDLG